MVGRINGRLESRVVLYVIGFMSGKEELGFINGLVDGECLRDPVNDRVGGSKPR